MSAFIRLAVESSRASLSIFLFLILSGIGAISAIPKELVPDLSSPYVIISAFHDGALPDDSETMILEPLEIQLKSIGGIKEMRGIARENGADIFIEFEYYIDIDEALNDVRSKIDEVKGDLPEDTEDPIVKELSFSQFPVITLGIYGNLPENDMSSIANDLSKKFSSISSVLSADIQGNRERVTDLVLNPSIMSSYNVTVSDISQAISQTNVLISSGALQTDNGRFLVKVPSLFHNEEDIKQLVIASNEKSAVSVSDVASVRYYFKDPETITKINRLSAVSIEVSKRSEDNLFDVITAAQKVLDDYKAALPPSVSSNIEFTWMQDTSSDVLRSLNDLTNNIIVSVLLVFAVLFVGLNIRSALIASIAIPSTFFISIFILYQLGITLNIIVLFGLILSVGMLIDASIVIIEYADKMMNEGYEPREAFIISAQRMFMPLLSSTATTEIVFLPLLFWPGIMGDFMGYLPKTLLVVLSMSLVVAVFLMPILGGILAKKPKDSTIGQDVFHKSIEKAKEQHGIGGLFNKVLAFSVTQSGKVVAFVLIMLFISGGLYGRFGKGINFFPEIEPELLEVIVKYEGNIGIYESSDIMNYVSTKLANISQYYDSMYSVASNTDADGNIGRMIVELVDWQERPSADVVTEEMRAQIDGNLYGVTIEVRKQEQGPTAGKPYEVWISSDNKADIDAAVIKLEQFAKASPALTNVETDKPRPYIDIQVEIDNKLSAMQGVSNLAIGQSLALATNGSIVGNYRPDDWDEEIDIRAIYDKKFSSINGLQKILIASPNGSVPLSNFITLKTVESSGYIRHIDATRTNRIMADLKPGALVLEEIERTDKFIKENNINRLVDIQYRGEIQDQAESSSFLGGAFMYALAGILLILLLQFNNFFYSFLILFAVIMATVGGLLGLIILRQPFGIVMSGLGVIFLAGIAVNNNIILIDTFHELLTKNKMTPKMAAFNAASQRLRPIFLTTVTTVLGLLPMAAKITPDFISRTLMYNAPSSQWWDQLSMTIVSGMMFSTSMTLFFTPAALVFRHKLSIAISRRYMPYLMCKKDIIMNALGAYYLIARAKIVNVYSTQTSSNGKMSYIGDFTHHLKNNKSIVKGFLAKSKLMITDFKIPTDVKGQILDFKNKVLKVEEKFYIWIHSAFLPSLKGAPAKMKGLAKSKLDDMYTLYVNYMKAHNHKVLSYKELLSILKSKIKSIKFKRRK